MHPFPAGHANTRNGNSHFQYQHPSRSIGHSGHNINSPFGRPGIGAANEGPPWWKPPKPSNKPPTDAMTGNDPVDRGSAGGAGGGGHRKGRAWLLIVAAGIAVGVACLIVCFLGVGRRLFIREKHKQSTVINYSI